jgi:hypothetical protein
VSPAGPAPMMPMRRSGVGKGGEVLGMDGDEVFGNVPRMA